MRVEQRAKPTWHTESRAARRRRAAASFTTGALLLALPACGGGGGGGGSTSGANGASAELSVASLTFTPSQANIGETIHVIDVVANTGGGAAGAFQVAIYLSADPFITSADLLIGLRTVPSLTPSASSEGGGFLTVPVQATEGDWYVGCLVDDANAVVEANEADNQMVATQLLRVTALPAPDLVPTDVSVDVSTVEAGQSIGVTDRVENLGVGEAGSFQVGIYLSQDATVTSGDVLCGVRSVVSLAPGEISFVSAPVTVPANTPGGEWYVGALADIGGTQSESDEFNNGAVASSLLTVTVPPRPDLRMVQLDFGPNQVDAGQSLLVSDRVINQGLIPAGPFRVGVYLSEDAEITTDDTLLGFRSLGGLQVGEESAVSAPLTVPASIDAGLFHVGAIADHEEAVLESDELNNAVLALGTVEVFVPPLPDLVTDAVSFSPTVVESGGVVTVVERVRNVGTAEAGAFRVGIYLSSNPSVTSSDLLLGSRFIGGLTIGSSSESALQFTLPPGIASGSWTVGVIADDLAQLAEPDEGNNLRVASGLLDITGSPDPLPDLVVESLGASPSQILEGGILTVSSLVRNEGELSAPLFQVRFYLSEDEVIEETDHLVGVRTIGSLAIDGGSAQSFPYTVDPSLPIGVYRFGAICDDPNQVSEADEENNVNVLVGTVEIYVPPPPAPDLSVTALTFDPASLPVGGSLQLDYTVKNLGDLDAGASHVEFYASLDEEVTTDDVLLGSGLTLPSLGIEAEAPSSAQLDLPAEVLEGTWHIGAVVLVDNGAADENDTNDWKIAITTLEVTP